MHFSPFIKDKKAEMTFLRVSDLLFVCVVLNHGADSPLYIIKMIFSFKINEKLPLKKCLLVVEDFDSLVPCLKLLMTSSFVSVHGHIMPKYG